MEDLHPSAGVRILLELDGANDQEARYRAAVYTPTTRFDYQLVILLPQGTVTVLETQKDAGAPFSEFLRALARSLAREALATAPVRWPRRLLRWRDK